MIARSASRLLSLALLFLGNVLLASEVSADDSIRIVVRGQPTNFFGGEKLRFSLMIQSEKEFATKLSWQLVAASRTLARGEKAIELKAGAAEAVDLEFTLPPVKEGVVYPLHLEAAVSRRGDSDVAAELNAPIYLFAANPFAGRQRWAESLNIKVFDPAENTAAALTALEVPFDTVTNLHTLSDLKTGVLIVGEGVAWENYGGPGSVLMEAARRGVFVICLAPSSGTLPLATSGDNSPERLLLARTGVIRDLDKRFSTVWQANEDVQLRSLVFLPNTDSPVLNSTEFGRGWPWAEIYFGKPPGRLIWCGFGVIRSWDESPTPRYLLATLLETYSSEVVKQNNLDSNLEVNRNE